MSYDTLTPVSAYLVTWRYPHSLLLESSDYHANNNDFSYICCNPIGSIELKNEVLTTHYPTVQHPRTSRRGNRYPRENPSVFTAIRQSKVPYKFITNGLFGYIAHEAVERFDRLDLNREKEGQDILDLYYAVYQNIIAISLFNHEAHLFSMCRWRTQPSRRKYYGKQ